MYLVHPKKHGHGKWEVAWTWLPFFLAADKELVKYVDQELTKEFKGVETEGEDQLVEMMHEKVINLIVEHYPIPGLREHLGTLEQVKLENWETES